ncbi:MAG: BamA/TamA family outer membrane protein [Acidobacteriia bacterium]|nr:BamA/TamA family outer membrane protein [Terriglobia bacterium]
MSRGRRLISALLVSAAAFHGASARAASLFDPALRFRALRTPHFVIYFHQGEDRMAGRLAVIAENAWQALQQPLGVKPPPLTHVVLADQTEQPNGTATPVPYNTIVINAVWPAGSEFIGNLDDWLRLAFTHEFTHITHLDRSESWARALRAVFGRQPFVFPNLYLPVWQIEGLATYEESAITGEGRLHDGSFRAIVDEAARQHTPARIDRVGGGLVDWPGGLGAYAYGLGFHEYLADRFGAATLATLADATARRVPYTGSRVFKRIYGESLGDLWRDYEASLSSRVADTPADVGLTRLTHHRFTVAGPRFDRFACASCPAEIVYSVQTPHSLPTLNRVRLDGGSAQPLTVRILGTTSAIGRDAIYFDQIELRRNAGYYGDLYKMSRASGRVEQLTTEARLLEPDLSPDEQTIVAVQSRPGQRDLVLVRLKPDATTLGPPDVASAFSRAAIETLIGEPDTQFNAPRWSPDGRTIAVERHRLGAMAEIVLVDVASNAVRVVASDSSGRVVTPTWRPDGHAIVVAMAHEDAPFNLYEIAVDESGATRKLTHTTGGATWPDVSPDGKLIVFAGYTTEGIELFSLPYPEQSEESNPRVRPIATSAAGRADTQASPYSSTAYSPLPTLKPTSWSPVVDNSSDQLRVGASVFGSDVLGYHVYSATATWLVSGPAGSIAPGPGVPDWELSYLYNRWRVAPFVSASTETSFFTGLDGTTGRPLPITLRERQLEGGVQFPVLHIRQSLVGQLSLFRAIDDYTLAGQNIARNRTSARLAGAWTSAHRYGYSISPEDGMAAGFTAELTRHELGAAADATRVTADVRAYVPGFGQHQVLAIRGVGAAITGDVSVARTFLMGGAARGPGLIDFGSAPTTLMRGFESDTFGGTHVVLTNLEYRIPLARPQRGLGTWPAFLQTIHAAGFTDVGHAWTNLFRARDMKVSVGAELSVDAVAGYFFPVTLTAGVAHGHDGSGSVPDQVTWYFRLGRAF